MKKVVLLFIFIIIFIGILPNQTKVLELVIPEKMAAEVGNFRADHYPYRNTVANNVIKWAHQSPFLLPSQPIPSQDPRIVKLAMKLTKGKHTDIEKSRAIFTWIAKNITYDADNYLQSNSISVYPTAVQVLKDRKSLCMGFSRLNAALHRAVGIEAKVVYGGGHAWNEIMLNNRWQTEDATNAAGYFNEDTKTFVKRFYPGYFSKTDYKKQEDYAW